MEYRVVELDDTVVVCPVTRLFPVAAVYESKRGLWHVEFQQDNDSDVQDVAINVSDKGTALLLAMNYVETITDLFEAAEKTT